MDWKQYQDHVAQVFRNLGCDVTVEAAVQGARAKHKIDVLVRFKKFGIETVWIIECKMWKAAVPKEKVLALKAILEDVGADRGLLISETGVQVGAVRAAEKTNITLSDLEGLKEFTQEEFLSSALHRLEIRATQLKNALFDLYTTKRGPNWATSSPRPGVDGKAVNRELGKVAILLTGFEYVRVGKTPYMFGFDESVEKLLTVDTTSEFVARASEILSNADATLKAQKPQASE